MATIADVIGESLADPGMSLLISIVVGLPALFFIIKALLSLFPGYRAAEDDAGAENDYDAY